MQQWLLLVSCAPLNYLIDPRLLQKGRSTSPTSPPHTAQSYQPLGENAIFSDKSYSNPLSIPATFFKALVMISYQEPPGSAALKETLWPRERASA